MSVKEKLIEMIRGEGYDFFTAAEMATQAIKEFRESDKTTTTLRVGKSAFTMTKTGK